MKALLSLLIFCTPFLNTAKADFIDYSRGYCVLKGEELKKENAILTIDHLEFNNGRYLLSKDNHMFFDATSMGEIRAVGWSGLIFLRKTGEKDGQVFTALYDNLAHITPHKNGQLVECIAYAAGEVIEKTSNGDDIVEGDSCMQECGRPCNTRPIFCGRW